MSAIDSFRHEHIGWVRCPMRYSMYRDGRIFDRLPVYRLLEDIGDETSISGRAGDILIGGGFGEASVLSFSVPAIIEFFARGADPFEVPPITSHWSIDDAFVFGGGFEKVGWNPDQSSLRIWLAEHLVAFLVHIYPARYGQLFSPAQLTQDGSIFMTLDGTES